MSVSHDKKPPFMASCMLPFPVNRMKSNTIDLSKNIYSVSDSRDRTMRELTTHHFVKGSNVTRESHYKIAMIEIL